MSTDQFLDMGGYADYVWPAYGISAIILLIIFLQPIIRLKQTLKQRHQPSGPSN